MSDKHGYIVWISNSTAGSPPKGAPFVRQDDRSPWERLNDQFRELQRRGW